MATSTIKDALLRKTTMTAIQHTAASATTLSAGTTKSIQIPIAYEGFSPIGVVGFDVTDGRVLLINVRVASGPVVIMWVKNTSSESVSITPNATVLWQKN